MQLNGRIHRRERLLDAMITFEWTILLNVRGSDKQSPIIGVRKVKPKSRVDRETAALELVDQTPSVRDRLLYQCKRSHRNTPCVGSLIASNMVLAASAVCRS